MGVRIVEAYEWRCESCQLVELEYDRDDAEQRLMEHIDEYHD